jgi:hypothetical protein
MRPSALVPPLLAFALIMGMPSNVSACTCTNLPDFDRAYASSDAIFLGEVLSVEPAPEYSESVWATIRVEADWKGSPPAEVRVLTAANDGICGFPFQVSERYLVFAFSGGLAPGDVGTHLCWRTHLYYAEDPDLVALGPTPVMPGSWGSVKVRYR